MTLEMASFIVGGLAWCLCMFLIMKAFRQNYDAEVRFSIVQAENARLRKELDGIKAEVQAAREDIVEVIDRLQPYV